MNNERKKAGISSFSEEQIKKYERKYTEILSIGREENKVTRHKYAPKEEKTRMEKYKRI